MKLTSCVGDGQEVAEQHVGHRARALGGQRVEEQAETGGHGQDRPGDHFAVGGALAQGADHQCPADTEHAEPDDYGDAQKHGARRSGQSDVSQRMGGERGVAHHHEVADQPGGQRDDSAADQGVAHEPDVRIGHQSGW